MYVCGRRERLIQDNGYIDLSALAGLFFTVIYSW